MNQNCGALVFSHPWWRRVERRAKGRMYANAKVLQLTAY